jgi:hypothetical protein
LSSELPYDLPAPRSGRDYQVWLAEVHDGCHGCLDAPVD